MIRVGLLSYWHVHAVDYMRQILAHPDTTFAGVWDEDAARGRDYSGPGVRNYGTVDEMLTDPGIDAVVVTTATSMHRDVMVKAAAAGKHIFSEKVLAPTLKECNEIVAAVNRAGVKLIVSMPQLYAGFAEAIRCIVDEGQLGELTLVRARMSHDGATANWLPPAFFDKAQCGGGALIDLGCHPMYLTRLFMGMPESVSAHYGCMTGKAVEDNAAVVLKYAGGALGIVEAGFVNGSSPFSLELHGTEGTVLFGFDDGRLKLRTRKAGAAEGWQTREVPADRPSPYAQWVEHIKHHTSDEDNVRMAVDLTRLMEASNLSASRNAIVRLTELADT